MRTKVIISLLSFFFMVGTTYSQSTYLKVYSNFYILSSPNPTSFFLSDKGRTFFDQITFSVQRLSGVNKSHEFEFGYWKETENESFSVTNQRFHFRHEIGREVALKNNDRTSLQAGPAYRLFYASEDVEPGGDVEFRRSSTQVGISIQLFGHLKYRLTNKLQIDLNVGLLNGDFGLDFENVENPILTEQQMSQTGSFVELLNARLIRIGLAYQLGRKEVEEN